MIELLCPLLIRRPDNHSLSHPRWFPFHVRTLTLESHREMIKILRHDTSPSADVQSCGARPLEWRKPRRNDLLHYTCVQAQHRQYMECVKLICASSESESPYSSMLLDVDTNRCTSIIKWFIFRVAITAE